MPKQVKYLLCPFTGSECASMCALAGVIDGKRVCALACLSEGDKAIFKRNAHAANAVIDAPAPVVELADEDIPF